MQHSGICWQLTAEDLIRANKLIQVDDFDVAAFESWYVDLLPDQQDVLAFELLYFATQGGVDEPTFEQAVGQWRPCANEKFERELRTQLLTPRCFDERVLRQALGAGNETTRLANFRLCALLFAVAERKNQPCTCGAKCTYWWHQDLHNPQVVDQVLRDVFGQQRPKVAAVRGQSLAWRKFFSSLLGR
jgi:hypothetical protein